MIASTPADYKPHVRLTRTGALKRIIPMCLLGMIVWLMAVRDAVSGPLDFDPARTIVSDANHWWAKELADINGNGRLDLVVVNDCARGGWLGWYETSADAQSWTRHIIAHTAPNGQTFACGDLELGDFDNDGDIDVLGVAHPGEWDAAGAPSTIYWYENDNGTWTPHLIGTVDAFIKDIDVADFNGDGRLDLAVVLFETHSLVIFRQDTPTNWTKVQDIPIANLHEGMDVGDIDGDGDPDIAANGYWIENPGGDLTGAWTVRSIDARWHSDPAGGNFRNNATKVFCRDITGDGRVEVFISDSENAEPIMWYESEDPKNGPWTGHVIAEGYEYVHTLQVFDMDLDGDFDVVTGENAGQVSGARFTVFLNGGDNLSWTAHEIDTAGTYNSLVGDVDGDGDYDIWRLSSHSGARFELMPNVTQPGPSLDQWTYIQVSDRHERVFGLAFGDVTGDGLTDIASGRYVYANPGGSLTGAWSRIDLGAIDALFVVDVDGDAFADVVSYNSSGLFWHEAADAAGAVWTSRKVADAQGLDHSISTQGYGTGQIVPGGRPELVINPGKLVFWEIPDDPAAGNWPVTVIAASTGGEGLAVADVDRDGYDDVFSRLDGGNAVWWKNPGTGAGAWTSHTIGSLDGGDVDRVVAADVNGDGRVDVIVTEENLATSGAETSWFEQPADLASGTWTKHVIAQQASTHNLDAADLDGDGDIDVVTGEHYGEHKVIVWENDGSGSFTPHAVDSGRESHLGTRLVDLDGDGDLDIVSIAWSSPQYLHVWRNDGGGGTRGSVRITEDVDEGLACYRIVTPTATYFYDRAGGGFTSMLDKDGTDWIGWNTAAGSAGEYRGIPNTGELHPGYTGGITTTSDALDTPLPKVTIETTRNGWGARWEFYPTYARMTLHTPPPGGAYWFLYEGTPGGAVDAADRLVLSNGRDYSANADHPWGSGRTAPDDFEDIVNTSGAAHGAEWAFFSASETERSLFLTHTDDAIEDDYWQMEDNMTVFGFGRSDASGKLLSVAGTEWVIGFAESRDAGDVADAIHAAWNNAGIVLRTQAPTFDPPAGAYIGVVRVELSSVTAGGEIRYTLDGSDPNSASPLYTNAIQLAANTTVKARTFKSAWLASDMVQASYILEPDTEPPEIVSVTAVGDPNVVTVAFGELVDEATAEDLSNYGITPGITVSAAELQGDGRTVRLSVSELSEGVDYTLTAGGIEDLAGNALPSGATVAFSFEPRDIITGLMAHWRFDEREGNATDSAGDHDGTLHGPTREAGRLGRALRFDGNDDRVDTGAWDVAGSTLTICAWINADRFDHLISRDARIVSKASGDQDNDHTWMLSTMREGSATRLRFRLKTGGSTTTLMASGGDLATGQWIHAAAVYNGSHMLLYKDGVEVGRAVKSGAITGAPSVPVWIGDNPSGAGDRPFDGLMDDVRVYARALTSNEVAYLAAWTPVTTIGAWGGEHGIATDNLMGDANEDGVPLLAEYAYGLDPTASDAVRLLPGQGVKGLPWLGLTATPPRRLAAEYVRRAHASDLIYRVTFADSLLSAWFPSERTDTVTRLSATWERVHTEDDVSVGEREKRFIRIEVEYAQ